MKDSNSRKEATSQTKTHMDMPGYAENAITEYKMEQNKIYGDFKGNARYDLLSVIMVCLGKMLKRQTGRCCMVC